jgi:alanine racemase
MARAIQFEGRPVWAEISLAAITHNLRVIHQQVGRKRKILAVVKANAYGLGAVRVSRALAKAGTDWFGVTCTNEGVELRDAGIRQPILLLTGFWPGEEKRLLEYRLTPTVTQVEQLRLLERASASLRRARGKLIFHLKVETGMNRLGIQPCEAERFVQVLADCPHLELGGTFTHFASAETFLRDQTEQQEQLFAQFIGKLRAAGVSPGIIHLANSGAICARSSTWADMVRPGAILYGYHQSFEPVERKVEIVGKMPLRPSLSLRARIISVKDVPPGQGVGYGARFVTDRPSRIAVIAAGYADGIVRQRSNRGCVLVRGKRLPIVGIISMDLAMLDVTDVPDVRLGDIATIYGSDDGAAIEVPDVARELGTVTSDLLCALGQRVPRFYLS